MMSPVTLLVALVALTGIVAALASMRRTRSHQAFKAIASEAHFHYTPIDRFKLDARLNELGPGVGDLPAAVVTDVMYRNAGSRRDYVFTVWFSISVGGPCDSRVVAVQEHADGLTLLDAGIVNADRADTYRRLLPK
ncbi:MAG: hypothetical protein QM770_16770 [Tepidisphaeraceae bacterium]